MGAPWRRLSRDQRSWLVQVNQEETTFVVVFRAQDQASMQLSEMEEEMDQRIHAAERKTRDQVGPAQTRRICSFPSARFPQTNQRL